MATATSRVSAPRTSVSRYFAEYLRPILLNLGRMSEESREWTPWKGGGFGMFSTLDHGAWRGVDVIVEGPNRSEALEIPPSLEEIAARAATCPTDRLLRQFAEGIVARERRYGRDVGRVTLTAWQTGFDRVTLRANERTLRSYRYDVR
jgi:hypothetical protein